METIIGPMEEKSLDRREAQSIAHAHVPTRLLKAAVGYTALTLLYVVIVFVTGRAPRIPSAQDRVVSRTGQGISYATPIASASVNDRDPAPVEPLMILPAPAIPPLAMANERSPVASATPSAPVPPTQTATTYRQSVDSFTRGVAQNISVDATSGLSLIPALNDEFDGDTLDSSQWQVVAWGRGGGVTLHDGAATMNVAALRSRRPFLYRTFAVRARFTAGPPPFQNIAWSADLNGATAILIGEPQVEPTHLYARVKRAGEPDQILQLPVAPEDGAYHVYQIAWQPQRVDFSVDGMRCATIAVELDTPMYAWISTASLHPLTVDWAQVLDYGGATGTFTSIPLDAGGPHTWLTLTLQAARPAGTQIWIRTRTSEDGESWTAYTDVVGDGSVTSPPGRYFQYEVGLVGSADRTPTIASVAVDAVHVPGISSGISAGNTIGFPNAVPQRPEDVDLVHERTAARQGRVSVG